MKNWWKILAVILMSYSVIAGLLTPLSPAMRHLDNNVAQANTTFQCTIQGYNTEFKKVNTPPRAWLQRDSAFALCASNIQILSDKEMKLTFDIPAKVITEGSKEDFDLIVDTDHDGSMVLPDAILVKQDSSSAMLIPSCTIADLNIGSRSFTFPYRPIIEETIRNLYFHVSLWFAMVLLLMLSLYYNIQYLRRGLLLDNIRSSELIRISVIFGILGLITGALWAKYTWGKYWSWDLRQTTAAIVVLIYLAYFVLRDSFEDLDKKARISAVYSIFAFFAMIPLMFVIPRLQGADSLHPGAGGNPAFGSNDLDNTMRMVFYPAVIGYTLFGLWIAQLWYRVEKLKLKMLEID